MVELTSVANISRSSADISSKLIGLTVPSASQQALGSCGAWDPSDVFPQGRPWLPLSCGVGFQVGMRRLDVSISEESKLFL
jgi:hypothetical protein